MDDLLSEFLTETAENLGQLDTDIVQLEENPNDRDLLSNIFRVLHTIKGTCGFLGLPRLEKLAHAAENVLGKFRDGELDVTPPAVSLILESLDQIKTILDVLENTQAEPDGDDADLIERLDHCAAGGLADDAGPDAAEAASDASEEQNEPAAVEMVDEVDDELAELPAEDPFMAIEAEPEAAAPVAAAPAKSQDAKPAAANGNAGNGGDSVANKTIRVNVQLLENLMTTVSELVLTRNQLLQILRNQKDSEFSTPLQRLNQVTSELQEGVMKTRMQPIGNAWSKLPRIVRDLSQDLGKKITLEMKGQDTELDRQVLELIKDPLTHMVRNSGDHGIEGPKERLAAGKPETGKILLNAYHEGGHIVIQIADDGKGLPVDKIKAKVLEKGLASEDELAELNDQQILQFIFHAGFSTAEKVTNVSGRGVGMDVVRTNIEKIGGAIDLKSEVGRGTTFTIKIPLTLAIVSALIVECAGERFAIPQIGVVELVRSSPGSQQIETINDTPVLRLRDRLLPLVSLQELLGLEPAMPELATDTAEEAAPGREHFIVVTQVGAFTFGIIVDRVFDTEEIVVKPVAGFLRDIDVFSGNTILGDGSVVMILDPNGIANRTGGLSLGEAGASAEDEKDSEDQRDRTALLLFKAGEGAPRAVPLALVARLEDIPVETVESADGRLVVQYRGQIMPLVPSSPTLVPRQEGRQPVIVFSEGERSMGLMVDAILDIVEEVIDVQMTGTQSGLLGSAVIADKTTEVIDVSAYLRQAFEEWWPGEADDFGEARQARRILLVDDSPFFRNMVQPLLQIAGYDVTAAEDGGRALEICETEQPFDAVISDIEMPGMDGFQLAQKLRDDARYRGVPLVALSSHTTAGDLDRGRAVGFTDYVAKFDRDALLQALSQSISETEKAA